MATDITRQMDRLQEVIARNDGDDYWKLLFIL
jgi:hypothetical protein